jgi:uncharacterized protein
MNPLFSSSRYGTIGYSNVEFCLRSAYRRKEDTMLTTNDILKRCKKALQNHYGAQFKELVLHGSTARHQADSMSDIDLLVVLGEPFDYFIELREIVDLLYSVQLESDRLISARPVAQNEFEYGAIQLYRNAKREGIAV